MAIVNLAYACRDSNREWYTTQLTEYFKRGGRQLNIIPFRNAAGLEGILSTDIADVVFIQTPEKGDIWVKRIARLCNDRNIELYLIGGWVTNTKAQYVVSCGEAVEYYLKSVKIVAANS